MKALPVITVVALLMSTAAGQNLLPPPPRPPPPKTVGGLNAPPPKSVGDVVTAISNVKHKARKAWANAKASMSDDKGIYTEGARQALAHLAMEIDTVATKMGVVAPTYFLTRLQALRQHHEYLRLKLGELGGKDIQNRKSGTRLAFDHCVASLEAAIDQAGDEAELLAKLYSPANLEAKQ